MKLIFTLLTLYTLGSSATLVWMVRQQNVQLEMMRLRLNTQQRILENHQKAFQTLERKAWIELLEEGK